MRNMICFLKFFVLYFFLFLQIYNIECAWTPFTFNIIGNYISTTNVLGVAISPGFFLNY